MGRAVEVQQPCTSASIMSDGTFDWTIPSMKTFPATKGAVVTDEGGVGEVTSSEAETVC